MPVNNKENPQCSEHQGEQNYPCERCFAYIYVNNSISECQPKYLYAFNGRKVAALWGNVLVKIVKGTKQMLRYPLGWACDVTVANTAKSMGANWFQIFNKETKEIYECSMDDFLEKGLEINRGFGDQLVLPIQHWNCIRIEEVLDKLGK